MIIHANRRLGQPLPKLFSDMDGKPIVCFTDGKLHKLTFWERCQLRFGRIDAAKLQDKYHPAILEGL